MTIFIVEHVMRDFGIAKSDLGLRSVGIGLLVVCVLSLRLLFRLVNAPPVHQATAAELTLATLGVIGFSAGLGLLTLGRHIHDQVAVSARWARLPTPEPSPDDQAARRDIALRRDHLSIETPMDRLRRGLHHGSNFGERDVGLA